MKSKLHTVIWFSLLLSLIVAIPAYAIIGTSVSTERDLNEFLPADGYYIDSFNDAAERGLNIPIDVVKPETTGKDISVQTEALADGVQRVTVSWGDQPNPGYRLTIDQITFDHDQQIATIVYQKHYPDRDKFYAQVISKALDVTFIPEGFEIRVIESE